MKRLISILSAATLLSCAGPDPVTELSDKVFELAQTQYAIMDASLGENEYPRTTNPDGSLRTSDIGWWCSGFYPGSLWYVYEYTSDYEMLKLAWKHTERLKGLIDMHTDHDIGFQINSSYGNALRLTGDTASIAPVYIAGARKLAERFTPATGVIKSWDFLMRDWRYPVIIDNMMNLEILTTASRLSSDSSLAAVAITHADNTLKNHVRDDSTTYHMVDYDPETGAVRYRETVQGLADESTWARGQAWALYGFTMMYRETGIYEYLKAAESIGNWIVGNLPEDRIPYWDFNDPDIPDTLRDASAAAIMASAFIELSTLTDNSEYAEAYLDTAEKQLLMLGSDEYLAKEGENAGFLLKHGVGHKPNNSEVDVPLSYADYYFLEALVRYSKL